MEGIGIPMIKLEVSGLKIAITRALTQYAAMRGEELEKAVEAFCTPENVARIISSEADRVMEQVIREEVVNWFRYGRGTEVLKEAVRRRLDGQAEFYKRIEGETDAG